MAVLLVIIDDGIRTRHEIGPEPVNGGQTIRVGADVCAGWASAGAGAGGEETGGLGSIRGG